MDRDLPDAPFSPHGHAQRPPPSTTPHPQRMEYFGGHDGKYFPPPPPPPILPRLWPESTDAKEQEESNLSVKEKLQKLKKRLKNLVERDEL
jgi:hypothetical protein